MTHDETLQDTNEPTQPVVTFPELAASRREWIDQILKPWCMQATQLDLRCAADEWTNIAGQIDVNATLWTWAWSRFPVLVHEQLSGVNETTQVTLTLKDNTTATGFPDSRKSENGNLILLGEDPSTGNYEERGPFSIDEILSVELFE